MSPTKESDTTKLAVANEKAFFVYLRHAAAITLVADEIGNGHKNICCTAVRG